MEPTHYPVDGVLDLHEFRPQDTGSLVPEYLRACREEGILRVRIVHGKGTGALRKSVHALLERRPEVERFHVAGDRSGWGATIAHLRPWEQSE
ncbi:MAG: DNA mismatch repair protein MutS [Bacteroidetes bacterium QS_8_68_15]|jgi:DNA-nicking Smr family endonuclease|nr:MAG: DNA mismatch repair protein MutS [Bacteroidetes bacterium QS_8_68_15]